MYKEIRSGIGREIHVQGNKIRNTEINTYTRK